MTQEEFAEKMADKSIHRSSGNVFRDLDLPDAEESHVKVQLAVALLRLIEERKLTRSKAAKLMGVDQAKLTALKHFRMDEFSIVQLLQFASGLQHDVLVVLRPFYVEPSEISR
jgi:predicted XRE-type DNA-binding protein